MSSASKELSFFQRLKRGLEDGIRHARGEINLRTTIVNWPDPPPAYSARDIQRLRKHARMSQAMFARVLNVSVKTVQSWEQNARKPSQAALRLLQLMETNADLVYQAAGGRPTVVS
jgi:putative transcriptional regulator